MNLKDIEYAIPPDTIHISQPRLIELESSQNLCNGRVLKTDYIAKVRAIANKYKLRMHLDAARGLNAAVALNIDPALMVKDFDTVNFCLSKGMGCPIGSLIIGSSKDIEHARVIRKMLGGQMRQVGLLAACGLVSLENWQEKLKEDNENALWLATVLSRLPWINRIDTSIVETNIFRFSLTEDFMKSKGIDHNGFAQLLREKHNILVNASFTNDAIRVVTHRDVSKPKIEEVIKAFKTIA